MTWRSAQSSFFLMFHEHNLITNCLTIRFILNNSKVNLLLSQLLPVVISIWNVLCTLSNYEDIKILCPSQLNENDIHPWLIGLDKAFSKLRLEAINRVDSTLHGHHGHTLKFKILIHRKLICLESSLLDWPSKKAENNKKRIQKESVRPRKMAPAALLN